MKKISLRFFFLFLILPLVGMSQVPLSQIQTNYAFTGNGNWSLSSNWLSGKKPPGLIPKGDTVFIRSSPDDSCLLDVAQYMAEGAVLKVEEGSRFVVKSDILTFVPADATFTDPRDSKVYPIKKYGTKIWMTANLNYNQSGSKVYGNDNANAAIYGRLYTWDQAMAAVPAGWHLPSRAEWNELIAFLGESGPMKDTLYWQLPNSGATNSSGFNARPGGLYTANEFEDLTYYGDWWSSTEYSELGVYNYAYYAQAGYNSLAWSTQFYSYKKLYMFSVRCVKN
jgi:uncharacterized protein (TIGR02145 family)